MTLGHRFDDPVVVAGQGTLGFELADEAPYVTDVLVSIGGGALISGVAVALKTSLPDVRVWCVENRGRGRDGARTGRRRTGRDHVKFDREHAKRAARLPGHP